MDNNKKYLINYSYKTFPKSHLNNQSYKDYKSLYYKYKRKYLELKGGTYKWSCHNPNNLTLNKICKQSKDGTYDDEYECIQKCSLVLKEDKTKEEQKDKKMPHIPSFLYNKIYEYNGDCSGILQFVSTNKEILNNVVWDGLPIISNIDIEDIPIIQNKICSFITGDNQQEKQNKCNKYFSACKISRLNNKYGVKNINYVPFKALSANNLSDINNALEFGANINFNLLRNKFSLDDLTIYTIGQTFVNRTMYDYFYRNGPYTLLGMASYRGNYQQVKFLLNKGATLGFTQRYLRRRDSTPLEAAVGGAAQFGESEEYINIVELLLSKTDRFHINPPCADSFTSNNSPLKLARRNNLDNIERILLEYGVEESEQLCGMNMFNPQIPGFT